MAVIIFSVVCFCQYLVGEIKLYWIKVNPRKSRKKAKTFGWAKVPKRRPRMSKVVSPEAVTSCIRAKRIGSIAEKINV